MLGDNYCTIYILSSVDVVSKMEILQELIISNELTNESFYMAALIMASILVEIVIPYHMDY
jgi:hypothetical protein